MKGIFITLEGNEGCGKSTQIKLLTAYLKNKGCKVLATREPGGTPLGDAIREALLNPRFDSMTPLTETLLYMASRSQLVQDVILPALKKKQVVLCDRWLDATVAYQGYAGDVDPALIHSLGKRATQHLRPQLSLYLDLPVAVGLKRAKRAFGPDRVEKKALAYHEKVRQGFLLIARKDPLRFRRLAIRPEESAAHVHERIKVEVDRVLHRR